MALSPAVLAEMNSVMSGPPDTSGTASLADYFRALGAGTNNIISSAGQGLEFLDPALGRPVREFGQSGERYWQDAMTPAGQEIASGSRLSSNPFATLGMAVAQSAPGMAAMFVPGLGFTKGLEALGVGEGVAGALGMTKGLDAVDTAVRASQVAGALGAGLSEGAYSGLSNAASQTQEGLDVLERTHPEWSPERRYQTALGSAKQVAATTAPWDFATSVLTGGGALGPLLGRLTRTGVSTTLEQGLAKTVLKDMAAESLQEGVQSAGEQYLQNIAATSYDPSRSPTDQVLQQAIIGAGAGGVMGGAMGGIHGVLESAARSIDETKRDNQRALDAHAAQQAQAEADAKDAEKVVAKATVEPELSVQDHLNALLGIGDKPQPRADVRAAFNEKIDPTVVLDEQGVPHVTENAGDVYMAEVRRRMAEMMGQQNPAPTAPAVPNLVTIPDPLIDRINAVMGIGRPPATTAANVSAALNEPSGTFVNAADTQHEVQLDAGQRMAAGLPPMEAATPPARPRIIDATLNGGGWQTTNSAEPPPKGKGITRDWVNLEGVGVVPMRSPKARAAGYTLQEMKDWRYTPEQKAEPVSQPVSQPVVQPEGATNGQVKESTPQESTPVPAHEEGQNALLSRRETPLSEMSYAEMEAKLEQARASNDALDLAAVRKHFGVEEAAKFEKKNRRQRDKWLEKNATEALENDSSTMQGTDEESIKEHMQAVNDFDTDSPEALGRSIALRTKNIDSPNYIGSPDYTAVKNALAYAASQGWSEKAVLDGMRSRAAQWAGNDAPELFSRLFKPTPQPTETQNEQVPRVPQVRQAEGQVPLPAEVKTIRAARPKKKPTSALPISEQISTPEAQGGEVIQGKETPVTLTSEPAKESQDAPEVKTIRASRPKKLSLEERINALLKPLETTQTPEEVKTRDKLKNYLEDLADPETNDAPTRRSYTAEVAKLEGKNDLQASERFSEKYRGHEAALAEKLATLARKLVPPVDVEGVRQLFRTRDDGSQQEVAGSFNAARQLIKVSLRFDAPEEALRHEAIHALRALRLFSPAEWTVLDRAAKAWRQQYGIDSRYDVSKLGEVGMNEEAVAEAFAHYLKGQTVGSSLVQRAFSAAKKFIQKLGNLLHGAGFQHADDVFDKVESGEVGVRNSTPVEAADEKFSVPAERVKTWNDSAEALIAKAPAGLQGPLQSVYDNVSTYGKRGLFSSAFNYDLGAIAKAAGLDSGPQHVKLVDEKGATSKRLIETLDAWLTRFDRVPFKVQPKIEKFLKENTLSKKWAYQPAWGDPVQIDPTFANRLAELEREAPGTAQLIQDAYAMEHAVYQQKIELAIARTEDEYAERAKDITDPAELKELKASRDRMVGLQQLNLKELEGPYAPLKRLEPWLAVGKSNDYLAAEEAGDKKAMERMKPDPKHYFLSSHPTPGQARKTERELRAIYGGGKKNADTMEKKVWIHDNEVPFAAMQKLQNLLSRDADLPDKQAQSLKSLASDMYISTLAETSARHAEQHRLGVSGADDSMVRSIDVQGRADAHFISALMLNKQVQDSLSAMENEARDSEVGDRLTRSQIYNEFLLRHAASLEYVPTPFQDKLGRFTAAWMLTLSPGFLAQQTTQPFMMSLPKLAGQFGYAHAFSTLKNTYFELKPVLNGLQAVSPENFKNKVGNETGMLVEMGRRGRINTGIISDVGSWSQIAKTEAGRRFNSVMRRINNGMNVVESVNRITSAVAAYRLDYEKQLPKLGKEAAHAHAVEYADEIIQKTQGNYEGSNAPRWLMPGASKIPGVKLVMMFRKFQIIQLSLIAGEMHKAFRHADPEERAIARKTLGWILAHQMVMTGAMGVPFYALIAPLLGMALGGDDEPWDEEYAIRRAIDNETLADLILNGVPKAFFGVSATNRLGMGQMTSLLPFTDVDLTKQSGLAEAALAISGPFYGGLLPRAVDGANQIRQGDYYKGLEKFSPAAFSGAMKAYRYATEGVTMRNGDMVLSPDEITLATTMLQAIGFPSSQITDRQFSQSVMVEFENAFKQEAGEITHRYNEAHRAGDQDTMEALKQDWRDLQDAKVRNGFSRVPVSTLLKAPREQAKRERSVVGGIETKKQDRGMATELEGI
jgi:hypothetical protein